ncbi:MAG: energy-coupling factor transporter ATPase [Butyribacter sp.]|nr:energy-coupling factor transporter ATPase [bacterium]MDY3855028.1 energy-coupling factor transporter ATPase [Butyribacter sp.]
MSLILHNVSYTYGKGSSDEKQALRNIDLEIGSQEFTAIVGHTGSGKSTLLQLLNGLEKATEGTVYYDGKDIYDKEYPIKELRSKVGLVFQYPEHQLFESSVIRDVEFGPRNLGWDNLQVELSSYQALKDVGIGEELLDVSPLALSGGQKRRVALAGVLAMQPEILVLDEPMAGLDPMGRQEIFELLQHLHKERKISVIFASHSMDDVAEYAKRVIVMQDGKIVLDGTPRQVFQYEKELEQIGLGVPAATRVMHRLRADGNAVDDSCITAQESVQEILRWYGKRGAK